MDFPSKEETLEFLDRFRDEKEKPFVKIGMELYYAEGPEIVREIRKRGHRIFLDLKLHDIPNTVRKAMKVLSALDVDIVNVHAAGGRKMMEAAIEGLTRPDGSRPLLVAVTQLTSTDERMLHDELLIPATMEDTIRSYARNAALAGLDGVVCSPLEAATVKEAAAEAAPAGKFIAITPGIRFAGSAADDQSRITTPAKAYSLGADYIVVGRPVTQAPDPVEAYRKTLINTEENNDQPDKL